MRLPSWLAQHLAALRALTVFTVLLGLVYPLALVVAAMPFGTRTDLIGQSFVDADGEPVPRYFQSRPSAGGYDPTATGASNLGPESLTLLGQVCARSKAVGDLEGVDGSRPYCTPGGAGAVLGVFRADGLTGPATRVVSLLEACPAVPFLPVYENVPFECAREGEDVTRAVVTPIRGAAPASPVVPADAVTASGSGLDPHISPAYARLQAPRVARERGLPADVVLRLVRDHTTGPVLGFLGEPAVNVVQLNRALDRQQP